MDNRKLLAEVLVMPFGFQCHTARGTAGVHSALSSQMLTGGLASDGSITHTVLEQRKCPHLPLQLDSKLAAAAGLAGLGDDVLGQHTLGHACQTTYLNNCL